mgnify:CR=1 FL=1
MHKREGETYTTKQLHSVFAVDGGFLAPGAEIVVVDRDRAGWTKVALVADRDVQFDVLSSMLGDELL